MRNRCVLFVPLVLLAVTGCYQSDTLIKVKPDGSGTIVQTIALSKEMIGMMQEMAQGFGADTDENLRLPSEIRSLLLNC